jgi:aspartokinase-like uncharacterized kinase
LRIVKVGGSLLQRPGLVRELGTWNARQSPARTGWVFGGGEIVDGMRRLDQRFSLDPKRVHWRCIELLRATWEVACELFPQWNPVNDPRTLDHWVKQETKLSAVLISIQAFYYPGVERGDTLPESWSTTSDALAGFLATRVRADELVLLKNCEVRHCTSNELVERGIIDPILGRQVANFPSIRIELLS